MYNSAIQYFRKFRFRFQTTGFSFLILISLSLLLSTDLYAQGNLMISPKRVVFEGQKRIMEVNLSNTGLDSAKYTISFVQFRMTEDGKFEEITTPDPGQNFSDKNIRYYPRSVMLGPNESQIVKLQLTSTDQMEPGEYRSHLFFRSMTPLKALGADDIKKDSVNVSINIQPTFGITIPVIIRVGESTTTLNITDMKLETGSVGNASLNLIVHRKGNMSVYGDLSVFHIAPTGKETKIGLSQGEAVYSPNTIKRLKVTIDNKSKVDLTKGKIRVVYSSQSESQPEKYAEAIMDL